MPWGTKEEKLSTLVVDLIDDTRDMVRAEVDLAKSRVGERVAAYKSAVIFFAIAGVLALAALIALLVGLVMAIATLIGPGFATAIVVVVTLVVAGALAMIGKGRLAPAATKAAS